MLKIFRPYSILIFFLPSLLFASGLSDTEKNTFIKSSYTTCYNKNIKNNNYNKEQKEVISEYCSCQGKKMANLVTKNEIKNISKGKIPQSFIQKNKTARNYCLKKYY